MTTLHAKPAVVIEQLRRDGYQVNVRHLRLVHAVKPLPLMTSFDARRTTIPETTLAPAMFSPCGGRTEVQIKRDENVVAFGATNCSPRDNYNKATGLQIALGRALKGLEGVH